MTHGINDNTNFNLVSLLVTHIIHQCLIDKFRKLATIVRVKRFYWSNRYVKIEKKSRPIF